MRLNSAKKFAIIGVGGFGKEVLCCLIDILGEECKDISSVVNFYVDDKYLLENSVLGIGIYPLSKFNSETHQAIVAIGDPMKRKQIVDRLPSTTEYPILLHPSATISKWVEIGKGSIVTAGSVLTCDINLGNHAIINLNSTVGHDCRIGDFFTSSPGVNISGNCNIGNCVYIGTNASVREKITITDNVTIGMGAVVLKNIETPGIYGGIPAKLLQQHS